MDRWQNTVGVRGEDYTVYKKGKTFISAALFIIFSIQLLLSIKIATSQTVGTYHPSGYNLVDATSYTSGVLTNLQSDDNVYMTFGSYFSGTDTLDSVDNGESDVDSSADKGTHGNFSAQQYGPDSLFDNLTETDTGGPANGSENLVDDNTSNIDGVDDKGTHGNFTALQYCDSYFDTLTEANTSSPTTYQIHPTDFNDLSNGWSNETNAWDWNNATSATETKGKIDSDIYLHSWNSTGQGTISQVDLRIRLDLTGLSDDYLTISWYVGATQGTGTYEINSTNQGTDIVVAFNDVTEPINGTWEWTDIGNIEIRQVGTRVAGQDVPIYALDEVWGWVSASTPNYELDLEIRWTTADYDETNEYLCINVGTTDDEDLQVDVWTGSWTNLISDLNASSWNNVSVSSYLTSDTLIVRFLGGAESDDSSQDSWQIECSLLHVWSWGNNYSLDLEIQWTEADYTRTNEELCIKTGTTDTEDIEVYVWDITGSSWHQVFDDLAANTWNNISVSTYLTDSNFTARFRGGNETGDATQDSWSIDVVLLHIWSDEYTIEIEFVGLSDTNPWAQLEWSVDGAWTTDSVSVTLQLYNYSLGDYPTNGNGYVSYISSAIANTDETKNKPITVNPTNFRNSTGYWKVKSKGVKATDAPFDFKADLIKFAIDFASPSKPFDWAILYALLVIFGVVFISAVKLNRKKKTNTFSELFGMNHEGMIGKKMLLEIDPTSDYHKALLDFASEAKNSSEPLFIFTSTNSALHSALPRAKNEKFFLLTSNASSLQQINEKVTLLPAHDLSILLNTAVEALKEEKEKPINILFDNISSIIIRCGFEKTYSFTDFLLKAIASPKVTALFVFNPAAHDPETTSSIRGLFPNQLAYTKSGPKVGT